MRPLLLTGLALLAPACGWRAGLVVPAGHDSIGVEVVTRTREVVERGLEPRLTDELSRAVSDLVGLPLARPGAAALVVRGQVVDYRRRGGVRSTGNVLLESAVYVEVTAELFDRRRGVVLRPAASRVWSGYALDDPAGEATARDRALRHVAETLVLELFQPEGSKDENRASAEE